MVIVEASHRTIRLICSPSEAFGVDTVAGDTSGDHEAFKSVRPCGRAANEHVTVSEVRNPALQCPQFASDGRRWTED
jgi:hypothetical protein